MKPQNRRSIFKKMFAGFLGITGASVAANATPNSGMDENGKEVFNVQMDQDVPLFSGATKFAGMVFVAGKGAHFEGDIKAHTDHVLKELEKELEKERSVILEEMSMYYDAPEEAIQDDFDELLFPTLQPTYTIPTISLSNNSQTLEIGSTYDETLTITAKKNDAGDFVYLEILRNGDIVDNTSEPDKTSTTNIPSQYGYQDYNNPNFQFSFSYNENYVIPSGITSSSTNYRAVGSYLSGLPKNTNKGTLDTRPSQIRSTDAPQAADSSFNSATKTITGIYPYYYGVSDTEPTLQEVIDAISGGTATKVLVNASGNLTINYGVTTKFLWFAHLASYGQKTQWYVSADNKGLMSSTSLFDPGLVGSVSSELGYWSNVNFYIYLGNYATTINSITLGNNLF